MRIVYAGQGFDYGSPARGRAYEEYAFGDTLVAMGHEVIRFDTGTMVRRFGLDGASSRFAELATKPGVDLVFVFLFEDDLDPAVVRSVTDAGGAPTLTWFGDDHWRYDKFSKRWAPSFSHVATTLEHLLPNYRSMGVTPMLTQWAAAPCNAPAGLPTSQDVSFVGQAYGTRPASIARLRAANLDVETRGYGWGLHPRVKDVLHRKPFRSLGGGALAERLAARSRCDQETMTRIFESTRININFTEPSQGIQRQVKGRTFEVPASGGFLLTGPADGLAGYLEPETEIVVAADDDELVEKARWWLGHESQRATVAKAGYRRVNGEHRFEHRFAAIFEAMGLPR